jgi:hypothetical protein
MNQIGMGDEPGFATEELAVASPIGKGFDR